VPYQPEDLRAGDIVLVEGHGLLSALIRWSTANPFTHAALATGNRTLVEADLVVVERPAGVYATTGWVYRVRASDAVREAAVHAARVRIGETYGIRELLLDAMRFDLHLVPRARPVRHATCSGLVAVAYASAGLRLTWAPWPAPADLSDSPLLEGMRPWVSSTAHGRADRRTLP
jgi:hypothetical protein